MIFYQIASDAYVEDGVRFVATKAEALREARELVAAGDYATVHRVGIPDTKKASILALANNREWACVYEKIWEEYGSNWSTK